MIADPPIETERLRLRPYTLDDLDPLTDQLGDAQTMRYYPRTFTRDEAQTWIENQLRRYELDGFGLLVMEDRSTGAWVGQCGPATRDVDAVTEVEIGWLTAREHWGKGYAPEAGAASARWVFDNTERMHVISLIRPENEPSTRVADKIGMTRWRETMYKAYRHDVWGIRRDQVLAPPT